MPEFVVARGPLTPKILVSGLPIFYNFTSCFCFGNLHLFHHLFDLFHWNEYYISGFDFYLIFSHPALFHRGFYHFHFHHLIHLLLIHCSLHYYLLFLHFIFRLLLFHHSAFHPQYLSYFPLFLDLALIHSVHHQLRSNPSHFFRLLLVFLSIYHFLPSSAQFQLSEVEAEMVFIVAISPHPPTQPPTHLPNPPPTHPADHPGKYQNGI